jgi:hypothetical protein
LAARAATSTARRERPVGERGVEVVAAERRVAAGGDDFEHALRQAQQRDVEGAAAEVIDGVQAFGGVVETVGHRRCGGLVDQAQHVQAGEPGCVLRRLTLCVVEVGGHGDHRAEQVVGIEAVFGALAQRGQDLGRDFDRRLHAVARLDRHHAGLVDEAVGQLVGAGHIGQRATHQALDGDDGVQRVVGLRGERIVADAASAAVEVLHGRRQQRAALRVGQALGHAVAHGGDERVRRAEVDAHCDAPRVRIGRLTGLGDLQQGH